MPTLIRLIVALLFLGGLAFAGMFALSAMVDPGEREVRVRIPARDLMMTTEDGDPVNLRDQLPAPTVTTPPPLPPSSGETSDAPATTVNSPE
jgi:hypothetical protein